MALVVQTFVPRASEADADRVDQEVNSAIMQMGGPPTGLMAHIAHPSGDGFVLCEVWRSDAEMRSFYATSSSPSWPKPGLSRGSP